MALDPSLEQILHHSLQAGNEESPAIEPSLAYRLQMAIVKAAENLEANGLPAVLLVANSLRAVLARFLKASMPHLYVFIVLRSA